MKLKVNQNYDWKLSVFLIELYFGINLVNILFLVPLFS